MKIIRQPENTKVCPGCGTTLIDTARHCSMCGYVFLETEIEAAARRARASRTPKVTISLPWLALLIVALLGVNTVLVLGWQKRGETKEMVRSIQATATYEATTYISPTPTVTPTLTPPPPTPTSEPVIEYTVQPGDSCNSIATQFQVDFYELVRKNDLNCDLLSIGTVLIIPNPTPTPEPEATSAPGG